MGNGKRSSTPWTMFMGECKNSSLKAFNSDKKKKKNRQIHKYHLMDRIKRESVRVSVCI